MSAAAFTGSSFSSSAPVDPGQLLSPTTLTAAAAAAAAPPAPAAACDDDDDVTLPPVLLVPLPGGERACRSAAAAAVPAAAAVLLGAGCVEYTLTTEQGAGAEQLARARRCCSWHTATCGSKTVQDQYTTSSSKQGKAGMQHSCKLVAIANKLLCVLWATH